MDSLTGQTRRLQIQPTCHSCPQTKVFPSVFFLLEFVIHHTNSGWQNSLSAIKKTLKKILSMNLESLLVRNTQKSYSKIVPHTHRSVLSMEICLRSRLNYLHKEPWAQLHSFVNFDQIISIYWKTSNEPLKKYSRAVW